MIGVVFVSEAVVW